LRLILLARAFVAVSRILPVEVLGGAGILSIAVETLAVSPAAPGRIVFATFREGLADIAVF